MYTWQTNTQRRNIEKYIRKRNASAPPHTRTTPSRRHSDWNRQCICGLNPIFSFFLSFIHEYTTPYTPTKNLWIESYSGTVCVPLRQKKICKYFSIGFGTTFIRELVYKWIYTKQQQKICILGIGNAYINIVSSSPTIYTREDTVQTYTATTSNQCKMCLCASSK